MDSTALSVRTLKREEVTRMEKHSLCPGCTACPEVVIDDNQVRIGEDANVAILMGEEWNVLVDLIQSGRLSKI
jgi:hypothetical protein